MGNHSIGRAFVAVAETAGSRRREGESALDLLDYAAQTTKIAGADAEFDDAPYEDGTFRTLLIEAFSPNYIPDDDEDGDRFYEEVYRPFSERYELC